MSALAVARAVLVVIVLALVAAWLAEQIGLWDVG